MFSPWKKSYNKPRQHIIKQRRYFANKGPFHIVLSSSQSYGFCSSHVWMWELGHKEGWAPKNWCFRTMMLVETLESPLESKEIKAINPKGNQSWIFIGRTDAEDEALVPWPPDAKNWLIGKDPDAGKVWGQDEKGLTETLRLPAHVNGQEFGQTLGDGEGQGSLVCCSPSGCKEFDMTELPNNKTRRPLSTLLFNIVF